MDNHTKFSHHGNLCTSVLKHASKASPILFPTSFIKQGPGVEVTSLPNCWRTESSICILCV